jgi:hypothetical protein
MFMDEIIHVFIDQLIKIDEMKLYMDEFKHHGSLNWTSNKNDHKGNICITLMT